MRIRGAGRTLARRLSRNAGRHLGEIEEDALSAASGKLHHLIRTFRRSADAEACVASRNQIARDRVEDLIEDGIADFLGSGALNQRKSKPLAKHWKMPQAEELQGHIRHGVYVRLDERRIVVRAGSVWAGD